MRILIMGTGGREHAIAWKVLQSPRVSELYINANNGSLEALKKTYSQANIEKINISDEDHAALVEFSQKNAVDLVVIGSETQLSKGLSDLLQKNHIPVFGPSKDAAEIEASKAFSKDFMLRHHIPTAAYKIFRELKSAIQYIENIDHAIVIKNSGLAGGKGVFLPNDLKESKEILEQLFSKTTAGEGKVEIVIEERLEGEEISLLAFTDGTHIKAFPLARDYKRIGEGDTGPNTGGMGAYAPVTLPKQIKIENLVDEILVPTINGLRKENRLFRGVIYAGLMLTPKGVSVLEFNCRLGDPETQVLLPLLETDLVDIMQACIEGKLSDCSVQWKKQFSACVVLASRGYPSESSGAQTIEGSTTEDSHTNIFQAGTRLNNNQLETHGGRVLSVSSVASNLEKALSLVYECVKTINFKGMQYRRDIGYQEIKKDAYANAGVNIAAGNHAVSLMSQAVRSTYGKEVLAGIGAFGGMYHATQIRNMQDPVLVASTDGIGTKVHLAVQANRWHSLGYDIVHHSINDILVQGAKPLFFLDYIASSKLEPEKIASIVTGMATACRSVGCALLGGETAEMPGVYHENMVDVAGTIVGIVERENALPRNNLEAGDVLLGLRSSGPHTNGYSLIRKIFGNTDLEKIFPETGSSLIDALLEPHRCYLPLLEKILQHPDKPIKGLVHITGGGFYENIPRILPSHLSAELNAWKVPPLFQLIQSQGQIEDKQMYTIFNMGIGMVIITDPKNISLIESLIDEPVIQIGKLVGGKKEVHFI